MKEIVIKIPDNTYKAIKDDVYCGILDSVVYDAIKNGTELPKGHGQLIDARAFLRSISSNDYNTYTDYSNTHTWITDAEVLIEEDRGEREMNIKKLSEKYPLAMKLHGSNHIGRLTLWMRIKMWFKGE